MAEQTLHMEEDEQDLLAYPVEGAPARAFEQRLISTNPTSPIGLAHKRAKRLSQSLANRLSSCLSLEWWAMAHQKAQDGHMS